MLTSTKEQLQKTSTPTIATILFKLGLRNQFIQGVQPLAPGKPNMVGEAFTLRYIPAREDLNQISVFRNPEHPQRVAVETCPEGAGLVMDAFFVAFKLPNIFRRFFAEGAFSQSFVPVFAEYD